MNNQNYLLPIGFYDLLGEEARINQESIDILLKKFYDYGYKLIKTPLAEFEDATDKNRQLHEQAFYTADIISGKNLALRSDITPQIARLLHTRLKTAALPIRLCYGGDVLKVKTQDLYADRQLTQVGIELIGSAGDNALFEVVNLILEGLNAIKLPDLLIDFCLPGFCESLLVELKIREAERLKVAIGQKNIGKIKKLGEKFADSLVKLTMEIADFEAVRSELIKLPLGTQNRKRIDNLQKIINAITEDSGPAVSVNIFGDDDFLYHEGIGFTIFEEGFTYPVARGGDYKIKQSESEALLAVGATVYINNLRKILIKSSRQSPKTILLPAGCKPAQIHHFQQKGYITINSLEEKRISLQEFRQQAQKLGCNFIYWQKEILPVK